MHADFVIIKKIIYPWHILSQTHIVECIIDTKTPRYKNKLLTPYMITFFKELISFFMVFVFNTS